MTDEDPEVRLPDDEDDEIEIADAEIDKEEALAVAQVRLTGGLK